MKLNELTIKELGQKLLELGMPEEDIAGFRTKAPMIATIEALSSKEVVEEEEKKVKTIEEKLVPSEEKATNRSWKNKAERMKAKLLQQEFVSMVVPLEPADSIGSVDWIDARTGAVIPFEKWESLSLDEKMRTYQKHVEGSVTTPQLNGFKYMIPKGQYIKVPKQIYEVMNAAQIEQLRALEHKSLNRIDPATGQPIRNMLQ